MIYDLLIIGGGINGAGIARDAAGRGAKVLLVEKDDLAGHTSSASTKLVHGGLRYLEHYEFRLVRESLMERERLLTIAPHIIWPLRFILPHDKGLRPSWLLRLGLLLYDNLGGRKLLPGTRTISLRDEPHASVLEDRLTKGFEYSDCWVEDARLVVLNCMDARERGADIRTRTECTALERAPDCWTATLRGPDGESTVTARKIVNAAGPWVDHVLGKADASGEGALRLVKGSHLVFPRLYEGDHAYIFQNRDNRIIFAIPYEGRFTLVGTTDKAFDGDPSGIDISPEEADYLCEAINEYLRRDVTPEDAVWSYAGVRPLYDDRSSDLSTVTRDYVFEMEEKGGAPILSIFGGKITTYRKLAEHALDTLGWAKTDGWTADRDLPGGDIEPLEFAGFVAECDARYPWFGPRGTLRLARAYGTRLHAILDGATGTADLGEHFGLDLYERELDYLVREEFAVTAEDVLFRRSKLGLHLSAAERQRVEDWFAKRAEGMERVRGIEPL
ncbi:glycerol-3-phosphate dehydrogenase [Aurantiacibacter gangjinensis]|uniref:glycerol-3-phosphate dehydrogenase n=1 Tax=Aurantiacibacter gangjinensis TaxID=502682 RepID=UPI00090411DE|nr:glycerol-3-phosphate dehydrogenase [Aurantiacibacter gangjinensis]